MGIVKELSIAARAPGAPAILGRAAQEIIRQANEIERLTEILQGSAANPATILQTDPDQFAISAKK